MTSYEHLADLTITLTATDSAGKTVTVIEAQDAAVWGQTFRALTDRLAKVAASLDGAFTDTGAPR